MTAWPAFSVAVLNHQRPHLLPRVLGAVAQLDYPAFEIVVVGDKPGLAAYDLPAEIARQVRYAHVTASNISHSRNVALAMSAGEIVAFCDDDAVPEPSWLRALAEAFRNPQVAAASGTVMASDGLTVEWQGCLFNAAARERPDRTVPGQKPRIATSWSQTVDGRYLGLIGVNSAFRRSAVLEIGGFDEAYRYFLDETDMAIRLARNGWSAALVPEAVVHHLREQNAVRSARRVPRDLYQIAASKTYFCHRHLPADEIEPELERFREARLTELDPFVRMGTLRRDGLKRLQMQLDLGLSEGAMRQTVLPLAPGQPAQPFCRFLRPGAVPRLSIALVSGWGLGRIRRIRSLARRLADAGHSVSCFSYVSGPQRARVSFADGVWLHSGGTWSLGQRSALGRSVIRRASRVRAEMARVAPHRNFDVVVQPGRAGPLEGVHVDVPGGGSLVATPTGRLDPDDLDVAAILRAALSPEGAAHGGPAMDMRRPAAVHQSVGYP